MGAHQNILLWLTGQGMGLVKPLVTLAADEQASQTIGYGRLSHTSLHPLARQSLLHLGLCFPLIPPLISGVYEALDTLYI